MTIEHAPSTNGRVSSGELYDEPKAYRQQQRRPRVRRRLAVAGVLTPLLLAIAALVVVRGLAQNADE